MKTITLGWGVTTLFALLLFLGGCSEVAEQEAESPHQTGWMEIQDANNFHGAVVLSAIAGDSSLNLSTCQSCHYDQTNHSWQCWSCHSYIPHTDSIGAVNHGGAVREAGYKVWLCKSCHGSDYRGLGAPISSINCNTCHTPNPEACNTCHGVYIASSPGDSFTWAPPEDLLGEESNTVVTVGAHQQHLNPLLSMPQRIGGPYSCNQCHVMPDSVAAPGHIDSSPPLATVTFDTSLADKNYESIGAAQWNRDTATCANTYCHGDFKYGNQDNLPVWTQVDGTQLACAQCHGYPPQQPGHPNWLDCSLCHRHVVAANDSTIIADSLHCNGEMN